MQVNFNGGDLTSDAGLLLYRSFDHKLGLSRAVEELLVVNDAVVHRDHPNSDVVIQKIYQHIGGYHTDDHADDLHAVPLLTSVLDKERLASQPTLSRVHAMSDDDTIKSLEDITETLRCHIADEKLDGTNLDKRQVYIAEVMYQATSWKRERRVVINMEKPAGERGK